MDDRDHTLPDLVLWRTDRCGLCEETASLVARLLDQRAGAGAPVPVLRVRALAEDPAAEQALFDQVPVLEAGGRRLPLAVRLGAIRAFLDEIYGPAVA